jgi:hypothetical protein
VVGGHVERLAGIWHTASVPSPVRVELEPGLLSADIHFHDVQASEDARSLPCWTAVTKGLAARGQRELALTVVRFSDDPEDFPPGLIGYLKAVRRFATEGRLVDAGGLSGYREPGPFGFGQFVGVAFEGCAADLWRGASG